jgi:hypothetical protein
MSVARVGVLQVAAVALACARDVAASAHANCRLKNSYWQQGRNMVRVCLTMFDKTCYVQYSSISVAGREIGLNCSLPFNGWGSSLDDH